ncbi:hypothetical protein [Mesonia maritima]|uniref:DUF4402 domain-containing protein n=1 Tax=Mesonia maritima TaxID=1793873 RepID=A0ABU1K9K3_9FLAO|nr:hypothetical protein [Mesonia maritima]MDR6302280.1 hypothetical protein [Mesonia maritima]
MKKIFISILLCASSLLKAQTTEELQNEIEYLQEINSTCSLLNTNADIEIVNSNDDLDFKVISVTGSTDAQTITLKFLIKHELVNKEFDLHLASGKPIAYNIVGEGLEFKSATFPNSPNQLHRGVISVKVPTNVAVQGQIKFQNVLPGTTQLSYIGLNYYLLNLRGNRDRKNYRIEIRNISVDWN